jgi:hypothetical protein
VLPRPAAQASCPGPHKIAAPAPRLEPRSVTVLSCLPACRLRTSIHSVRREEAGGRAGGSRRCRPTTGTEGGPVAGQTGGGGGGGGGGGPARGAVGRQRGLKGAQLLARREGGAHVVAASLVLGGCDAHASACMPLRLLPSCRCAVLGVDHGSPALCWHDARAGGAPGGGPGDWGAGPLGRRGLQTLQRPCRGPRAVDLRDRGAGPPGLRGLQHSAALVIMRQSPRLPRRSCTRSPSARCWRCQPPTPRPCGPSSSAAWRASPRTGQRR